MSFESRLFIKNGKKYNQISVDVAEANIDSPSPITIDTVTTIIAAALTLTYSTQQL